MKILEVLEQSGQRILVGIALFITAVLVILIDSKFIIWAIMGVVFIISFYEAQKLIAKENQTLLYLAVAFWILAGLFDNALEMLVFMGIVSISVMLFFEKIKFEEFLPFLYPAIPMTFIWTTYIEFEIIGLLWLILLVSSCDVGAYFIGKMYGKSKFNELSPNKTKEGVYGGVLTATLVGSFIGSYLTGVFTAIFISFFVAIAAVYGDLFESYLKRKAGVKDSGTFLLSHGGMLDRLDGYLFASVALVVLLRSFT